MGSETEGGRLFFFFFLRENEFPSYTHRYIRGIKKKRNQGIEKKKKRKGDLPAQREKEKNFEIPRKKIIFYFL